MTRVRKGEPTRKHITEADLKELVDIRSALLRRFHSTLSRLDKLEKDDSKMQEAAKYLIIANRLGKSLFECYRIQYSLPAEEEDVDDNEEEEDLALAWERFQKSQQEQGGKTQLMLKKDFRKRIQLLKQQLLVIKDDDHLLHGEQIKTCPDRGRSTGRNQ